ncbi:MAG: hypothetical protein RL603_1396 [Pseudomonadota bacterium]
MRAATNSIVTSSPRKLIFDCDPGVDDAVALLLAFSSPELDLLGVTTVAGNVSAALTARNACIVREIAGATGVPVIAGCTKPLVREPVEAGHFHGVSGLGSLPVFTPQRGAEIGHAVEFLIETLREAAPGEITLVVTGPMTNVAAALQSQPGIAVAIREIVVMGGARSEGGNITASAEYNIYADPHAAKVVVESGCPLVMFGLDVTHQVRATPARIAALRALGSSRALAAAQLLQFSTDLPENGPREQGAPLHDPCPIAWLLAPEAFEFRACHIDIETQSKLTLGHTAVEFRPQPGRVMHARWGVRADAARVFALLEERLR